MSEIVTVVLDPLAGRSMRVFAERLSMNILWMHAAAGTDCAVSHGKLRRARVLKSFVQLPSCVVEMEARGRSPRYTELWVGERGIGKLLHDVLPIPSA